MDEINENITYGDYLAQIQKVKDEDALKEMMEKFPGGEKLAPKVSIEDLEKMESIIMAMSDEEKKGDVDFSNDRRLEIAEKANVDVEEVHKLIRGFARIKLLAKSMKKFKKFNRGEN